jgi:hypothetical protein
MNEILTSPLHFFLFPLALHLRHERRAAAVFLVRKRLSRSKVVFRVERSRDCSAPRTVTIAGVIEYSGESVFMYMFANNVK